MTNISVAQLVADNCEVTLCRDPETGITAVVAGDGLDYGIYLFDREENILTSNECGFSSNIPYMSASEYLDEYLECHSENTSLCAVF